MMFFDKIMLFISLGSIILLIILFVLANFIENTEYFYSISKFSSLLLIPIVVPIILIIIYTVVFQI